jgi:hypothetical protein
VFIDDIVKLQALTKSSRFRHPIDFLIALHSPDGVIETGLLQCPPEKQPQSSYVAPRRTLSLVRFQSNSSRNCADFLHFSEKSMRISLHFRLRGGEGGILHLP